jgi:hypothetical protein
VLFVPGINSVDDIQTVASIADLGHVARHGAMEPTSTFRTRSSDLRLGARNGRAPACPRALTSTARRWSTVTYDQFAFTAAVSGWSVSAGGELLIRHFFRSR